MAKRQIQKAASSHGGERTFEILRDTWTGFILLPVRVLYSAGALVVLFSSSSVCVNGTTFGYLADSA